MLCKERRLWRYDCIIRCAAALNEMIDNYSCILHARLLFFFAFQNVNNIGSKWMGTELFGTVAINGIKYTLLNFEVI